MKSLSPSIVLVVLVALSLFLINQFGFLASASTQLSQQQNGVDTENNGGAANVETVKQPEVPIVEWHSPTEEKPSWLNRKNADDLQNKIEEAIRDRLNSRTDVNFNQKPLSSAMQFFSNEMNVPILIDEVSLQEESLSPEEPITLELVNAKCSNALEIVLEPMQLTYVIRREVIVITTRKMSANIVRCYDLSYIMPDNSLSTEVIELIEQMVSPDEWMVAGGTSSLAMFGSMLVVNAPESSHRAVEELLCSVSKQSKANMKPRRGIVFPKGIVGGMGGNAPAGAGAGMMSIKSH